MYIYISIIAFSANVPYPHYLHNITYDMTMTGAFFSFGFANTLMFHNGFLSWVGESFSTWRSKNNFFYLPTHSIEYFSQLHIKHVYRQFLFSILFSFGRNEKS